MATAIYKGYLIVSHANQNSVSGRWSVTVDISDRTGSGRSETIYRRDQFQSRDEAERWGIEQGREWVDRHV